MTAHTFVLVGGIEVAALAAGFAIRALCRRVGAPRLLTGLALCLTLGELADIIVNNHPTARTHGLALLVALVFCVRLAVDPQARAALVLRRPHGR